MKKIDKTKNAKFAKEIIFGTHSIIEVLKAKRRKLYSIYTLKSLPKSFLRVQKHLPKNIGNIQYVSREVLDRMAGTTEHMGIVALVAPFKYRQKMFNPNQHKFILLLDGVTDVRNFGAILRSAYCTGVTGIIICKKNGASLTAVAHKSSAGLAEYLDIYVAPSIEYAVSEIKKAGYQLYMSVLNNGTDINKVNFKLPMCLVIGNEESGITRSIQNKGTLITLPQIRRDISYNASVAAGILMFTLGYKVNLI